MAYLVALPILCNIARKITRLIGDVKFQARNYYMN